MIMIIIRWYRGWGTLSEISQFRIDELGNLHMLYYTSDITEGTTFKCNRYLTSAETSNFDIYQYSCGQVTAVAPASTPEAKQALKVVYVSGLGVAVNKITSQVGQVTAYLGHSALIQCLFSSYTPTVTKPDSPAYIVTYRHLGDGGNSISDNEIANYLKAGDSYYLKIGPVRADHAGTYSCQATANCGGSGTPAPPASERTMMAAPPVTCPTARVTMASSRRAIAPGPVAGLNTSGITAVRNPGVSDRLVNCASVNTGDGSAIVRL